MALSYDFSCLSALAKDACHFTSRDAAWRLSISHFIVQHGSRPLSLRILEACHHCAMNVRLHVGHLHWTIGSDTALLAVRGFASSDQSYEAHHVLMPTFGAFDAALKASQDSFAGGHLPLLRPFRLPSMSAPEREPIAGWISLLATFPSWCWIGRVV